MSVALELHKLEDACETAAVYVVEDDAAVLESLTWTLENAGYEVFSASSGAEMLDQCDPRRVACLLTDLRLPDMDGLELRSRLYVEKGCRHPFLVITGHGDIAVAVSSLRQGALDFLEKPFDREQLLRSVQKAIEQSRRWQAVQAGLDKLTHREQQVLDLVISGQSGKQIARKLGITCSTVDVHRCNIVRKMGTKTSGELINLMTRYSMR